MYHFLFNMAYNFYYKLLKRISSSKAIDPVNMYCYLHILVNLYQNFNDDPCFT